jgi:ribonuclease HII
MTRPHFRHERSLLAAGVWPVAGVDEAGRGPLAGPVTAAAVILDPRKLVKGLDDSKKLSSAARSELFELICARALAVGVGMASAQEIDRVNIRNATFLAMRRALQALAIAPAHALIDGNAGPRDAPCPVQTIVKGDAISISISAASIIAKVTRDRLMERLHEAYPLYGFSDHMGYGTPAHLAALKAHGPCPYHRTSFAPVRAAAGEAAPNSEAPNLFNL